MTRTVIDDGDGRVSRGDGDRRHASLGEVLAIATLILQVLAIVWGAGVLRQSVADVQQDVHELAGELKEMRTSVSGLTVDVGVLRDRSDKPVKP